MNLHSQDRGASQAGDPLQRVRVRKAQTAIPLASSRGEDEVDFATLVRIALTHKRKILSTVLLCLALAGAYVHFETPIYTATANLIIQPEKQNFLDLKDVAPGLSSDFQAMNTEVLILESRTLLGRVVDAMALQQDAEFNPALRPEPEWKEWFDYKRALQSLGLTSPPKPEGKPRDPRETAVAILRNKLDVATVPETFAIEVTVRAEGAEKSAEIANKIAELYITDQRETKLRSTDDAMIWLSKRVAELEDELEAAESKVRNYLARSSVITEEGLILETERLKRLRDDLSSKQASRNELRDRIARLNDLRRQGNFKALSGFTLDPDLGALARSLADGETPGLRARFDAAFQQRIQDLRANALRLERQVVSLAQGLADLESRMETRSVDFVRLQQLEREAESIGLIYEHSLARMKEISIQHGIQQADARILDPAKVPDYASHPRTTLTVGAGGVLGGVFGIFLAFLAHSMKSSFRSSEELEAATGLPVIGVLPDARSRRPDGPLRQIADKPASPMADAIRNLRATIQLSDIDAPPQVIMLTSSVPGEGKSIVSAALARINATSGKRVLLIDADLRHCSIKKYFNGDKDAGLFSVLSGTTSFDEAVFHDETSGMDILFVDEGKVTTGDIFGSRRFEIFLTEMRKIYDIVVIDTPPILAVSDTRIVAQYADAIVYVVRWNTTQNRMVQAGLQTLRQVNAEVTGLVLNRVRAGKSEQNTYYGYSYT